MSLEVRRDLIPVSTAKTAYGLLSEVCRLILAEPKRYNQGSWVKLVTQYDRAYAADVFPACGTIGCVAGWVTTLKLPANVFDAEPFSSGNVLIGDAAARVLGLNFQQREQLFAGDAVDKYTYRIGTLAYAKAGVKHIQKFQRQNKHQLLRTKV